MTLEDLAKRFDDFENCGSLKPVKMNFEITLLTISTTLTNLKASLSNPNERCNNYLMFRTIESEISQLQKLVEKNKAQQEIRPLLESKEYKAFRNETTNDFLNSQLQELFPHFLAREVLDAIKKEHETDSSKKLTETINNILEHGKDGKEKTQLITAAIFKYTNRSSVGGFLFDNEKSLKYALNKVLDIHADLIQATYKPLLVLELNKYKIIP